ncbi:flagellar motor rotation protein MotA [Desulfocucumis palustris]|uniref:Flagellar motor rotation protein MotA n=1 Tax=Desulfocucumis palustris TaxID=1898651 RepID=A0A2L2X8M1_9FIRM|nr:flagellar motor protein [Desulfocucumis palustris]GBF32274.1 flagellar motor rotation protein MotA [Desulfocucumis palustris]
MEATMIVAFLVAVFSLAGGFLWDGGHLSSLFKPSAALIVFGGTAGCTFFSFTFNEIKNIPTLFRVALQAKSQDPAEIIDLIVGLADEARREGLLFLENRLNEVHDPFLRKGIQLVVDGTDPELVRSIMDVELYSIEERHHAGIQIFEAAGGYAPTMGIIGTVMGLVHVLGSVSDPNGLASAIAVAFMATFYGIGSANVVFLPMAARLGNISKKEVLLRELMVEGIVSLQAGYNPILIRERLTAFLNPSARNRSKEEEEE